VNHREQLPSGTLPIHDFKLKPSITIAGIVLPISVIMVAGLLGKMWIVWLAALYVAVMIGLIGMIKVREAERREQFTRSSKGQCIFCGYALQGNKSGTCPECGKAISPPSADPVEQSKQDEVKLS
jgi:hypothetical protein